LFAKGSKNGETSVTFNNVWTYCVKFADEHTQYSIYSDFYKIGSVTFTYTAPTL
jgi:hypothetical protein